MKGNLTDTMLQHNADKAMISSVPNHHRTTVILVFKECCLRGFLAVNNAFEDQWWIEGLDIHPKTFKTEDLAWEWAYLNSPKVKEYVKVQWETNFKNIKKPKKYKNELF